MGIQLLFWIVLIASLIYILRQIGSRILIRRKIGQDQPYAAISDQQKTEINALNKQMAKTQKQFVDKYAEAGEISKAQADATKANIDASEQYRQQYSQQQQGQIAPNLGYAPGSGYGNGCCDGASYYGGMW